MCVSGTGDYQIQKFTFFLVSSHLKEIAIFTWVTFKWGLQGEKWIFGFGNLQSQRPTLSIMWLSELFILGKTSFEKKNEKKIGLVPFFSRLNMSSEGSEIWFYWWATREKWHCQKKKKKLFFWKFAQDHYSILHYTPEMPQYRTTTPITDKKKCPHLMLVVPPADLCALPMKFLIKKTFFLNKTLGVSSCFFKKCFV